MNAYLIGYIIGAASVILSLFVSRVLDKVGDRLAEHLNERAKVKDEVWTWTDDWTPQAVDHDGLLVGCDHKSVTHPFSDNMSDRFVVVCLDCRRKIDWDIAHA